MLVRLESPCCPGPQSLFLQLINEDLSVLHRTKSMFFKVAYCFFSFLPLQLFCRRQDAFQSHREADFLPRCGFNLHNPSNKCHVLYNCREVDVTKDQYQELNHFPHLQMINKRPGV